jgi:hypothetical protein
MKKVTMLGTGESLQSFTRDDGEIWGVNSVMHKVRILDRLFFFDHYTKLGLENLKNCKAKIVTKEPVPGLDVEIYPLEEISKFCGGTDYFANSFCYMIAYAIWQGFTHIRMFGADMATHKEAADERPGMEYWIGIARGRGIKVEISNGSKLCPRKLYGQQEAKLMESNPVKFTSVKKGACIPLDEKGERFIEFKNGFYQTSDPGEIKLLRDAKFSGQILDLSQVKEKK